MKTILQYQNISVVCDNRFLVKDVSFTLRENEILGIVGESGSGKSTILKSILKLLSHDQEINQGAIKYMNQDLLKISNMKINQIRGDQINLIFQDATTALCPVSKIKDQIYDTVSAHRKISKDDLKKKTLDIFEKLQFKDPLNVWNSYPFQLSGGMNQRVTIAISILLESKIIMADEPTSALDVISQKQVIEELVELRKSYGTAIIIVSHNLQLISKIADTILVLKDGQVVEYDTKDNILNNPKKDYTKILLDSMLVLRSN